ncbi:MAG: preprotein translocase subunit SecG [Pirellulaceae bacterium]|nr:preprotein translocase subunit SecG [Pirellulaceae bacterium]
MLIGAMAQYFFGFTIFVLSSFLVLLVLVQRGRGGGLTGALGGPGGQSAFGTKAGDLFTRITIGVATAWILLCATAVFMLRSRALPQTGSSDRPAAKGNSVPGAGASSGTTESKENSSTLPALDLSNLNLPKTPAATTPAATTPAEPSTPATTPTATPEATPPAATTPAATEPAPAATTPPATEPATPPATEPATPPATEPAAPATAEPGTPATEPPK